MPLPRMATVRQTFSAPVIHDIDSVVHDQINQLPLSARLRPGESVAVTAGSRGIANIGRILAATVSALRRAGAEPFLVPAMGSHGGGTEDGQVQLLARLGITEQSVGAPIRASMDTVVVTETVGGIPVHIDRIASQADHVLVVNRIKPHTRFTGPVESGLHKMLLIGLGKHQGAQVYHQAILNHSFSEIVSDVASVVLQQCGVLGGLAILENANDQTAQIQAVPPEQFAEREPELLQQASDWLPSLPVRECDLLIVDRIGKDVSGSGMDTNVVGRKYFDHRATAEDRVSCRRILVRGLTAKTHGNACGIGIAEFTTQSCVNQIDAEQTAVNCITALHPEGAMIPIALPTDRQAIEAALKTIGRVAPSEARVAHIADTLHLGTMRLSEACLPEALALDRCELVAEPTSMPINADGQLQDIPVTE